MRKHPIHLLVPSLFSAHCYAEVNHKMWIWGGGVSVWGKHQVFLLKSIEKELFGDENLWPQHLCRCTCSRAAALTEMCVFGEGGSRSSPNVLTQCAGLLLRRVSVCEGQRRKPWQSSYMCILYNLVVMSESCPEIRQCFVHLCKWKNTFLVQLCRRWIELCHLWSRDTRNSYLDFKSPTCKSGGNCPSLPCEVK